MQNKVSENLENKDFSVGRPPRSPNSTVRHPFPSSTALITCTQGGADFNISAVEVPI